ncbi:MAG TPA: hypothetical protein VMA76_04845 [Solirubrobacteraceae bacterium]|nr:hypothetical protein [Solirubrobacteraceae bacterium]
MLRFARPRPLTLGLLLAGIALAGTVSPPVARAVASGDASHNHTSTAGCAIRKTRGHCADQPPGKLRRHAVNNLTAPFRFFSPHSFWNTQIPRRAPLDPSSHALVSDLMSWVDREQTDRNGPWLNATSEGVTILTVPANQPTVTVTLNHPSDADATLSSAWSAVPLPPSARPSPGDNDLAVWQPSTDTMWEFFQLHHENGGWEAEWGGAMRNVSSNPGVYGPGAWPAAWAGDQWFWGVTAASFSIVGGAITYEDLKAGQIDHALALVYPNVRRRTFVSPAERDDGWSLDPNALPEGTRLRLDPNLNLAKLKMPPLTRMIALAAQRYGIIIRDQAGNIAFIQQDPTGDPAFERLGAKLSDGLYPSQMLASFPWSHLQVMRMDLHQGW